MDAITAENALTISRPEAASNMVMLMTAPLYTRMKASMAKMILFSTGTPASFTGTTARGWMMRVISRTAWLAISLARIILMPPPVEPEQVAKVHSNSIHTGANIGHRL